MNRLQDHPSERSDSWVRAGGLMGERIREMDWSAHPLGPLEGWPQSLKTTISLMLNSRFAMWVGWGREFRFFCNDAYLPTLGLKTDWLGAPASQVWNEVWNDAGPRAEHVVREGEATWDEDLLLFLERSGFPEETYHTFSYSPIPSDDAGVGGMLCVVTEETERVISERRLSFLQDLAVRLTGLKSQQDLWAALAQCLEKENRDLPFALFYLTDHSGVEAHLEGSFGIESEHPVAPFVIQLKESESSSAWPLGTVTEAGIQQVEPLSDRFGSVPHRSWDRPPSKAAMVPILDHGGEKVTGHLIVGLNPYRQFDEAYRGFLDLLAGQISTALSNIRAYEHERQRAEQLAAIDQAKTQFFSNVSHEFRTPLTLTLGALEDLLENPNQSFGAAGQKLVAMAHRNGLRLLRLVNTLLDFSRIEAQRMEPVFEPVDLAEVTQELAGRFEPLMKKAGLDLVITCPPLREPVYVDLDWWEKIVLNLLSNAFKFTQQGTVRVTLQESDGGIELCISDTGAGIPPEALPRLFERFYRVAGSQSRSHEGTGIGLALVQELVKLHEGDILVSSRLGEGTCFTVRLPRRAVESSVESRGAKDFKSPSKLEQSFLQESERWMGSTSSDELPQMDSETVSDHDRKRILLVDDSLDMREYIRHLLGSRYVVDIASDGQEGLEMALRALPDLVLTDVMMPRMNGFGLLKALRENESTRSTPVIFLSARAGEESRVEGMDAGADDYLVKPFDARELLARVSTHLALASIRQASTRHANQAEQHLRHILEVLPAGVYTCDLEGRITFFNSKAQELWRRTPLLNDLQERFCAFRGVRLPDGTEIAPEQTPIAEAIRLGKSFRHVEAEAVRHDGSSLMASVTIDPLRNDRGEIVGAINIFQDITESRVAARVLERELEDRQRAIHHANFLSALSQKLGLLNNPKDILSTAAEGLGSHLQVAHCCFMEADENADYLHLVEDWHSERSRSFPSLLDVKTLGSARLQSDLIQGVLAVEDTATHEMTQRSAHIWVEHDVAAFACAPFSQAGRLRTLLAITASDVRSWRSDELNLLENVVNRVQPLVEQARGAEALQKRTERMQLLSETLAQLLSARNPDTVVRELFAKVTMHLSADTFFNFMVNEAGDALELHSYAGISEETAQAMHRLEFGQSICGAVAKSCRGLVVNDIRNSLDPRADLVRKLEIQTYVCHPLMAGGKLLGTLSFASRVRHQFDEDELKFIRIVTHSAALVIEQLQASQARQRLAAIVASSDDAIISKDLNGLITSWNQGAQRIFGYEAHEVIGQPVSILIPEDRLHEEHSILEGVREGNPIHHYETVRQRKDGQKIDISLSISPIKDSEGRVIGASKIGRDITEKKKNEVELVRREQLYRSIGESINYGIWVCDAEGNNLYLSDSLLNLVGMTQEECANFGIIRALHPEDAERTLSDWKAHSYRGGVWEREHRFKGTDGQWHPVLSRGIPIRDENGQIIRWAGIHLDISTFKKTEEALRQQSQILALLNQVSSALVAERNLEKIVQSVTDACREISGAQFGAFFYNVADEKGESFTLYTLSGAPKEAFSMYPMPRKTELFGPTFRGEGVVRIDDVLNDPRYGKNEPYHGLPSGHLPVRSYLAVPVISSSGQVIGGLFLGHEEPGVFKEAVEGILMGMAAQAAIAIDNAQLYTSLQRELEQVKTVESALRESEKSWREMAESMPHLVWTCGPDGNWDFVSPQWCTYTGRAECEQRSWGWRDSIHPEDLPVWNQAWERAVAARQAMDAEVRIRRADGQFRWFKTRAVPVMDAGKNILKWYGSNTDIEDIKLTDNILREREAHLSAIFAQAGSGIVQTDTQGSIVMVNDAYCEIVARTRDELLGLNIHDLTHPDDRSQNQVVFDAMMKGGSSFIIEKRDVLPDGTYAWVRNSVVGIRDEHGLVTAGLIITQDITDSREAEDALRASEEQLRLVTDHAPVLLAQFDREHHYKFINAPYASHYGAEPQEAIGRHARDIIGDSGYKAILPMMEKAFSGERVEFEMAIPDTTSETKWAHVIFVPERSSDGVVVGIVAVLTDISMRKQVENDLEQARDRALEAVRAKDDFLARLSHELRTPLSPVLLLASEGSKNKDLPEEIRTDFETIRKNVDLEARLIDDLLDITRITRGKLVLEMRRLNVNDVIRDALATIHNEAHTKGVHVKLKLGDESLIVHADSVRLQQVLWNLLNNAVKFTPQEGCIQVSTRLGETGRSVIVEITDTGIGMTTAEIMRIFDAFSQGDHAGRGGSQRFGGLGLGLAISRMLMELHQGHIEAKSKGPGQGSTFILRIPLIQNDPLSKDPESGTEEGEPLTLTPERAHLAWRILLVEDHVPTRTALAQLLRRRNYRVETAGSLREAREQVQQQEFDLLISDLGLPDGTGYDLMEELRDRFPLKGIAVSGFGMEQDLAHSRQSGFVSHLIKPVRIEALESALAALSVSRETPA
ncbi:PAS domain S-box-containing protein [Prosthecobacter debontii]|uniref:histidine kinase n=1 Tax=Prosthecobacter debontii TaxID=48467 RepID=A0A1T4X198_9BACT|nr:PAS domain S-box protein [Prosthecobacter debontii]SKA82641.1 PAS domain S-box-containing protein [Prosthecobacter debontii]